MQRITDQLFQISLGAVNCFLVDAGEDGLLLIDTGYEASKGKIYSAMQRSGKSPGDISRIILTHTHPDHAGSAAAITRDTGALITVHAADAALAAQGIAGRLPHHVSPGLINKLVFRMFIRNSPNAIPPFAAGHLPEDGETIPLAGGIRVIHTPGHSAGHIALHLLKDDVLIAGDICANMMGLGYSTVYEDRPLGMQSVLKAASTPFDKAVFGHGSPLLKGASKKMGAHFSRLV